MKVALVFGTRPEAIKLFPVIHALRAREDVETRVIVTAQHRGLLDQVLEIAGIAPDIDLDVMTPNQTLDGLTAKLIVELGKAFDAEKPDRVVVHGDTLTTMVASLAAYYRKIPVAHVEAGLRSGDIHHPWPEEVNRRVVACIADMNFAPTQAAADALLAENRDAATIYVTGNTVIDALLATRKRVLAEPHLASGLDSLAQRFAGKRIVAVTSHRRENFGGGMEAIARSIAEIAARPDVAVIFPVHPNPHVRPVMDTVLGSLPNVAMIEPLDYPHFVRLLDLCHLVLTDSGGVQEEAPSLGKPVLVMRETTERPEGVTAGTAKLVGTDRIKIVRSVFALLDDEAAYAAMSRAHNPFGDGHASERIADIIAASAQAENMEEAA
ncbi:MULTISPECIES: non-hydrolyzing UDP-N-acetylglucosamine 2-epimerase [Sphingobium]|uniref:UDP-N-acetylglucosamine 2-epimerase (non-hydrolyzing) n=2 Tax=Sphingobium fuliginis (strain ATCC 27551) TaxID=336203 RepID=A0ABQ1F046_SPHSA|nr:MULTISPECIES: UDP-N-acetylglucosamine 2-epimerase (non-hydrolyzing) [Sphingobium]PNP98470.1 UDP-N-acetylglucosamine 2-epimerase [Sphingobium sp. SA916]QDC36443.1 UDP-N-acetylglucosamine 2-epimerase (non-hydrolyzing) [Sphingobium fuliginis ATCC 27551]RYL97565.1 UDP-N-acetylglucosamine 2-epimerase (non-hydrolyzing) [Sphingobium fuliginis]WDA37329.1 UDP-N-acetylglucosamine 2-epimerase (non-hydrolyzing) [Sphingobium sp. YC-XJ3]GFZ94593.1 UDP-N-acetyl glucosamine 2-epimerase [Sphingobium fuligin